MRLDYLLYICDITGRERVMVSLDVTEGRSGRTGKEMERMTRREKERDGIFRETGCHIHVLTPSWLTNGLLLSQARVTVRAWPRRVVFPENRLDRAFARLPRTHTHTHARLAFYRKFDSARIMIHSGGYRIPPCRASKLNVLLITDRSFVV